MIILLLLLALGLGLSVLATELSVGLKGRQAWLLGSFIFIGYCAVLLVGSVSKVTRHPQFFAPLLYWAIVSLAVIMNKLDSK